ncbi:MAG: hypothetical protein KF778_07820 [Rhodocyclaceae bacterium]|nr:hypothetical protein [Rhodocyclaceae bacterium]MBX3668297.1 hypothetical protein [Rhodocyclaceae bacterium]
MSNLIHLLLARRELLLRVVRGEDGRAATLAAANPPAEDAEARRLQSAATQGAEAGPRSAPEATIDTPLPLRTCTILYRQLPPELQSQLAGGPPPPQNKGRDTSR